MFMKVWARFLFLDPQDEFGPSISSSVVLCSFVPSVYIVELVLVVYLCPSDRLCGLVVRVSGYRYRGLGFDSRRYQIF